MRLHYGQRGKEWEKGGGGVREWEGNEWEKIRTKRMRKKYDQEDNGKKTYP